MADGLDLQCIRIEAQRIAAGRILSSGHAPDAHNKRIIRDVDKTGAGTCLGYCKIVADIAGWAHLRGSSWHRRFYGPLCGIDADGVRVDVRHVRKAATDRIIK